MGVKALQGTQVVYTILPFSEEKGKQG